MQLCFILGVVGTVCVLSGSESVLDIYPKDREEINSIQTEIQNNKNRLNYIESRLNGHVSVTTDSKAYYWGYIYEHKSCYECIIPFNKSECVPDSAYNDGVYTVPYDGVYVFSWTISTSKGRCFASEITVGGDVVLTAFADSYGEGQAIDQASDTATIVRYVAQNTEVSIRGRESKDPPCWDDMIYNGIFTLYRLY